MGKVVCDSQNLLGWQGASEDDDMLSEMDVVGPSIAMCTDPRSILSPIRLRYTLVDAASFRGPVRSPEL
jgi:hypothetical protein